MSVKHTVMMATMMKININNEKHEKKKIEVMPNQLQTW